MLDYNLFSTVSLKLYRVHIAYSVAETWRRVWGDGNFFRLPRFQNDGFSEKNPFSRPKFLTIFFSHPPDFSDFPFPRKKNHYFMKNSIMTLVLLCSYFRAHPTTLLLKILGGRCMGLPHLKFWGDRPPQSPLGLRP